MKKICHLTSVHPRYDTRIFVKECKSLQKAGYEVSLVVADNIGNETIDNINIYDVGKETSRVKRMFLAPKKVLKKAFQIDADIYHFHDPELLRVGVELIKAGKKVIYDVHEDVPRQILSKPYLKSFLKPIISKSFENFENKNAKKLTYIITATDFITERFKKINKNSVSVKNYPIIDELKEEVDWNRKENKACYVGAIGVTRGITEITKSLDYSKYKLKLAGKFTSKELENKILNSDQKEKIDFLGFVNRKQVKDIYNSSKVGLVTLHPTESYKDALPVKMFEYMLAGIPVISSDIPLWQEIIEQNNCGVCVDPFKPKEIAKAIDKLIDNDEYAKELGQNGQKAVIEKYNWVNEEKIIVDIYKNL